LLVATLAVLAASPVVARAASFAWSAPIPLTPDTKNYQLNTVACPSATQCTAVDTDGREVTFNPTSPGSPTPTFIDFDRSFKALACPSTSQCTAVDEQGYELTFDPTAPGTPTPILVDTVGPHNVYAVACPTISQCTAVDDAGREVTFNPNSPGTPIPVTVAVPGAIALACPSTSQCTAIVDGNQSEVTFNPTAPAGATPVAIDAVPGAGLQALACPSASECVAVDGNGNTNTASEVTFDPTAPGATSRATVGTGLNLTGVACPSASQCTAVDDVGQEVTFNPTASGTPALTKIYSNGGLAAIACVSSHQCTALAQYGQEVTFSPINNPGSPTPFTIDGGFPRGGGLGGPGTLACPSPSVCVATLGSNDGQVLTFNPSSPTTVTATYIDFGNYGLLAVTCLSPSQCIAVDYNGNVMTFDPNSPGSPTPFLVDGVGYDLSAVACPSTSQCTALDPQPGVGEITFNPNSPGTPSPTALIGNTGLSGVMACPSTTECVALGNGSDVVTFDPHSPASATDNVIDSVATLTAVACPSAAVCVATDASGVVTFDPSSPATAVRAEIDPGAGGAASIMAIACPSISECVAVDGHGVHSSGQAIVGDPTNASSWTIEPISGAGALINVACSSVAQCVVFDNVGNGFVGVTAPVSASPPSIFGQTVEGQTLTEAHGSWSPSPTGFAYQWQRCDSAGTHCAAISGAGSQSYTLTSADIGATIRVQETASNMQAVSVAVSSAQTGVVTAASSGGGGSSPPPSGSSPPPSGSPPPAQGSPVVTGYRITNNPFVVGASATPTSATATAAQHKTGTAFRYMLSESATVKIVISQRLPGRRSGNQCLAPTKKLAKAKRCTLLLARGTLTRTSHAGASVVAFSGRIASTPLKPGSYQATLTATDSAKRTSKAQTIGFAIVKR
jgi:hypothetical protein